jgi:imidazole glycerol-phosphate synthase subunit HisH
VGNFASIANMLTYLEIEVEVLDSPKKSKEITHLIIPGVGAFDTGMELLKKSGWKSAIEDISSRANILGICLGMQMLTKGSDEGGSIGIGLVNAWCKKFNSSQSTVPHMGWNVVKVMKENPIIPNVDLVDRFYFTHSYYVQVNDGDDELGQTLYQQNFTSVFQHNNIIGCQFHPEKSHIFGMKFLQNFASLK